MSDQAEAERCEDALRAAMLAGDVPALPALIDDRLVFTGPVGTVVTRQRVSGGM